MACTDDMNDSPYDQYNRMANYPESPRLDNDDFMENGRHGERGNSYGRENEEGTESDYEDEPEDDAHSEAPIPVVSTLYAVYMLSLYCRGISRFS